MAQISLTFPDGNQRDFAAGVTAAEVAASISPSLAKRADFGHARRGALRSAMADHAERPHRDPHDAGRGAGAGADPARPRPHHGPRGAGVVAGCEGHHRPGDRERLVLRLRPGRAVQPRGPWRDRGEDEADHQRPRPGEDRDLWSRADAIAFYEAKDEPFKVELVRGDPRGPVDPHVLARAVAGPVPWPAPAAYGAGPGRRLQADERRRRLLARRQRQQAVAAHLWRGLPQPRGSEGLSHHAGRGRQARPPQAWQGDGAVPSAGGSAGDGVLAPERLDDLPRAGRLHAPPPAARPVTRKSARRRWWTGCCGRSPATGRPIARTCSSSRWTRKARRKSASTR